MMASTIPAQPALAAVAAARASVLAAAPGGPPVRQRPDAVSAKLAARQQGTRVEDVSARTQTTAVFANPNGTWTLEAAAAPVHYRATDTSWQPIDSHLEAIDEQGYRWKNAANAFSVRFRPSLTAADFLAFGVAGKQLALTAVGAAGGPAQVADASITYPVAWPSADLVYSVTGSGVKEIIRLADASAPASYQFRLRLPAGASAQRRPDGSYALSWRGKQVLVLAAPTVTEAADPGRVAPADPAAKPSLVAEQQGSELLLRLSLDPEWLATPTRRFPVELDPTITIQPDVEDASFTPVSGSAAVTDQRVFMGATSSSIYRAALRFDLSSVTATHITNANLNLYFEDLCLIGQAGYCGGVNHVLNAHRITSAWTTATTGGQLTSDSAVAGSYTWQTSVSGTRWMTWPITALVQAWAAGTQPNYGLVIKRNPEVLNISGPVAPGRRFTGDPTLMPKLQITYNSYPSTPTSLGTSECFGVGCSGTRVTGTTTPTLTASATDPDAGTVLRDDFELWAGNADVPSGSPLATTSLPNLSSGQVGSWTVPAGILAHGGAYEYRVRAWDGTDYGPWSPWLKFTVDLDAPTVSNVTSAAFARDGWSPTTTSGTFAFTSPSSDVAGWRYWFDDNAPTDVAAGATYTTPSLSPGAGWHVLHVQALDKGFNRSGEFLYAFGNGVAVTVPADGQRTAARVPLGAAAPPGHTGVRFQYRLPGQSTWVDLPVGDVTLGGSPLSAWPVATDSADPALSRAPANLAWNLAATRAGTDGPVELQAQFTGGPTSPQPTNTVTVTLETKATGGSYATEEVGPGSVTLVNGAFTVSATNASMQAYGSDLTVTRTFNSLQPTTDGVFGRGWQPSLVMDAPGVPWSRIDDASSSVTLVDEEGGALYFTPGSTVGTYRGVGETLAAGLKLTSTGTGTSKRFALTYLDGTIVTFTTTATAPTVFRVATVQQPGDSQLTTYTYDASARPLRMLAPVPPGVTCTGATLAAGCRALDFTYTSNRITAITLNTTNTAGSSVQIAVACFSYDANGRLTQAWDPRPAGTTCGTPVLATGYGYDATTGRLTSLTPPGLRPWTIQYDTAGRLWKVSRSHADGSGTETTTLTYGAAIGATTTDANPDLSASRVAQWGQQNAPVTAVAVFEPGDNTADLRDAELHALDAGGRQVNTAVFSGSGQAGWKVTTTEYDRFGNTQRTLSAANHDLALAGDPVSLGLPAGSSSVEIARALDEVSVYAADGIELVDTYGPWHNIAIDGGWVRARAHTRSTYGQLEEPGADPTVDGPKHAIVQRTVAASQAVTASPLNETDARTTRSRYALSASDATGWTFTAPMAETTVMGGGTPDIVRQTRYHATTGQMIETRQPTAAGTSASAGTTKTTYYTAGAHNPATCVSSVWYGLACKVEPGAQPGMAGLAQLPVKTFTYDAFLRPTVQTETVVDAGGTTRTRTTTTTYENAGNGPRPVRSQVTGGLGTIIPATTISYDPATGLPSTMATVTTPAVAIGTLYDDFGRPRSVTDADNATTETTYSPSSGRPQTITWKDPAGAVLGTQTLAYGGGGEHRGLPTAVTDSGLGGGITATYNADARLASQTMPNGITATRTIDPTGDVTKVAYAKSGSFWFDDRQDSNIHGQWRFHFGPSGSEAHGYDPAGRLTGVWDTRNGQPCVMRTYGFDANSNRTTLQAWPADASGNCPPSTTPTTTSYSYDAADRLQPNGIAAGLAYDAFGRTTTLPASLAGGTQTTIGYYTTDMVASQAQGGVTRSRTLDPAGRLRAAATTSQPTKINHYSGSGDSPAWIDEGDGTRTRYVVGLDGNLAVAITSTGTTVTGVRYQLVGLHGDVITTTSPGAATPDGAFLDYDEFGSPRGPIPTTRYGWLGGATRETDSLTGLLMMGARLYAPGMGRFLQVDPVPGGGANAYEYGAGDPINNVDLDGRLLWCGWFTNSWTVYDWFWARGIGWVPLRCGTSTWGYKHIRGKHGWGWSDNNETLLTLAFGSRVQQGTAYVYRKNFSRWSWCGCYVIRWTRIVVVETRNRMGIITSYRRYY